MVAGRREENRIAPTALKGLLRTPGVHKDGGSLRLIVKENGTASWTYRYMVAGKEREKGLGPAAGKNAVTLAEARRKRDALRVQVREGIDPVGRKQEQKAAEAAAKQAAMIARKTFRIYAEDYVEGKVSGWRNAKHRQQWTNTLKTYVYPVIGDLPVTEIGTSHILEILKPIWSEKPETASRVRQRMEVILDAAKVEEYRHGENPARWRGHLKHILPASSKAKQRRREEHGKDEHHAALPWGEVPAFIEALAKREAVAALALEFTILTAARTGEVIGAKWEEVDLEMAIWTIPGSRMKAGKEHRVPLSKRAVEILKETAKLGSAYLFPGNKGGKLSNMGMAMLLRRMKVDVTVHGFRSSFRDWAGETTAYPREVIEHALAHQLKDKAEAAYARGDLFEKRRRLMDDWAAYCATGGSAGSNVTPIRKAS